VIVNNLIHDSLHGVYVRQADGARIENNTILGTETVLEPVDPSGRKGGPGEGELCEVALNQNRRGNGIHIWNSSYQLIAGNRIRATRDGVYFSFVDRSDVRDNDIEGVRYGLHYMYSDENRFERNIFRNNAAGAAIMSSHDIVLRDNQFLANRSHRSYGVLLQTVDRSVLERNRISGNTVGVFFESGHGNRLVDNQIDHNHIGIHASDSSDGNQFAGNSFVGNVHTVETTGGNLTSRWAIDGRGNYWDDAMFLDLNRDGIGDVPHRELDLFGSLRRDLPVIGLLGGSPAERLLRFVHARLALPGLAGVVDPAPLTVPPRS
jgi:nitrous oxidase accessory protein